ncbi:MAG: hypothetical protein AB7S68_08175 [Polyangiaceae bacterium]
MSQKDNSDDAYVHRLIDMVVEEVSLVDRAANKHRFLVVKRDAQPAEDAMDDEEDDKDTEETDPKGKPAKPKKADGDPTLTSALTALENLTNLVERLGANDTEPTELAPLVEELESATQRLAAAAPQSPAGAPQAPGTPATPTSTEGASGASSLAEDVAATKRMLGELGALLKQAVPQAAPAAPQAELHTHLTKLAESIQVLTETVKDQQQRLGRVEKQFGLPNSAAPGESVSKADGDSSSWPLDLNKPFSRESVDKAVSFHDL